MSITSVRHCRCISEAGICSAAAGHSRAAAGADQRCPGARARHSVRLHPGIRQLLGQLRISATCHSSRRTTGARPINLVVKFGAALSESVLAGYRPQHARRPHAYSFPHDNNNLAPRVAVSWDPAGNKQTSVHAAYGVYYDNTITATAGVFDVVDGSPTGVRTVAARLGAPGLPVPVIAWNSPGHILPESAAGRFASLVASVDPISKTPYAHHFSTGLDRQLPGRVGLTASYVYARGFNQLGTIDYNPVVPSLGAGRRPLDVGGVPGTSASVLQYSGLAKPGTTG